MPGGMPLWRGQYFSRDEDTNFAGLGLADLRDLPASLTL